MKTKEQVETMLLKCRLAAALADEDGYDRPVGWCDAIRWVLDHGSKDHWFESDVASRIKDHMCEE